MVFGALTAVASSAHAQTGRLVRGSDGSLHCEYYRTTCSTTACESGRCLEDDTCVTVADVERAFRCCGLEGCGDGDACDLVVGDFTVCTDDPRCLADDLSMLPDCFAHGSWEWSTGDCDGDGMLNGDEPLECACVDAYDDDDDTGPSMCKLDGGVPMTPDAGTIGPDAGGANTADAGRPRELDAGGRAEPRADGLDYRGSGGCTCGAAGSGGEPVWLLLGIAVLLGRRMRRVR